MILLANGEGASGVETAARLLKGGAAALDAIEAGIRVVEANPDVHSVGPNSWPNILGTLQLDAAVMDGTTRRSGAVGALEGFAHPISIARAVTDRLPHEILVGDGAARFAREIGAEPSPPPSNLVEETWRGIVRGNGAQPDQLTSDPKLPLIDLARAAIDPETVRDTTVYLASDAGGNIASGAQHVGLGLEISGPARRHADHRRGLLRRHALRRRRLHPHRRDDDPHRHRARRRALPEAWTTRSTTLSRAAVADLAELAGGQLGTVVIHAIDSKGKHKVVCHQPTEPIFYWLWTPDMPAPERRSAESL